MLNSREISVGCLFVIVGVTLGLGMLVISEVFGVDDLGRWGIAALCIACTLSIHRSVAARDERLRQAFDYGREHERVRLESIR